jgi:5'-nucleotidase
MKILLTNDDGIYAPGIEALAGELAKDFEIEVAAPDHERSASSHSITFLAPLWVKEVKPGWKSVSGTSVDCVNLAVNHLMPKKPDLVVSGINRGANLGCDIFYSGTVAGAREAGILGIPAFAISVERRQKPELDYLPAARFARKFAKFVLEQNHAHRLIYNVNFPQLPGEEIKGIRFTRQGIRKYGTEVWEREDPRGNKYYWLTGEPEGGVDIPDSDIMAIRDGFVSISPLALDFTDYGLLAELKQLDPGAVFNRD